MRTKYIDKLSALTSIHKIIPFLGAGCSLNHLNIDWDKISNKMINELNLNNLSTLNNLEIAQKYVDIKGNESLVKLLDDVLKVDFYNEDLDIVPLVIASLGIGLIYTTNQDNIFEKCIEQYGKEYKVIRTITDLSTYLPGESLYIKYHGDTTLPETLIFTENSFKDRINDKNHFLNIKMKADLLTKTFLFIGYSFRDPNIRLIFEELNNIFDNNLPPSYLVAYHYTKELEELNKLYGIIIIDPLKELPHCHDEKEAFEQYLNILVEETLVKKADSEMEMYFKPKVPPTTKVVNRYEINSIERALEEENIRGTLNLFRGVMDLSSIPKTYQERTRNIFLEICKNLKNEDDIQNLEGALFNLTSLDYKYAIDALAGVLTRGLYINNTDGINLFKPHIRTLNESIYPLAMARAIEYIKEWDLIMNDNFRSLCDIWIKGYSSLPDEMQEYIEDYITWAWEKHTTYENPISRLKRLEGQPTFATKTFTQNSKEINSLHSQGFTKPYEEN